MIKSISFSEGGYITERGDKVVFLESGLKKIDEFKSSHSHSYYDNMSDNGFIRNCRMIEDEDYRVRTLVISIHSWFGICLARNSHSRDEK